ncbi:MAG: cation transporter [Ruminococcaceae bacterium]|nr:cation transporter [Oscillospiraceae bacterium]
MTKFLIKKFVPDYENTSDKYVRERYTVLAGIMGIICNFLLFLVKLFIGVFMGSIAIISDGFNNLTDMGSSLIGIIGAKLSNMRPDKEHPFGHGRLEYISSLIVAFLIILVGIELFKASFAKIFNPQKINFDPILMFILILSVFIKLWMYIYNRYMGKKINSQILTATSKDSINDVFSTITVIVSTFLGLFTSFPVDAVMGILVSGLILYSGYDVAKETINLLLGNSPDKELVNEISNIILNGEGIVGIHDLIVHDYGPGRIMASVHAEVPSDVDIIKIHEVIDELEQNILNNMGIMIVIHMDPILVNCEKTNKLKEMIKNIVNDIDVRFSIHDFRITDGDNRINLIFDIVVPCDYDEAKRKELILNIKEKVSLIDKKYSLVIHIDNEY